MSNSFYHKDLTDVQWSRIKLCLKKSRNEKILKEKGARLQRHGTKHDVWENPLTGQEARIGRHAKEIPKGTIHAILNP